MINYRKKDYFQRILEEFFIKLQLLINKRNSDIDDKEARVLINNCYKFLTDSFEVTKSDSPNEIIQKLGYNDLIEQYARLLYTEYILLDIKYEKNLRDALYLVEYLQKTDVDFSWDRTVLREDILKVLGKDN
jgi:hypothetical protein